MYSYRMKLLWLSALHLRQHSRGFLTLDAHAICVTMPLDLIPLHCYRARFELALRMVQPSCALTQALLHCASLGHTWPLTRFYSVQSYLSRNCHDPSSRSARRHALRAYFPASLTLDVFCRMAPVVTTLARRHTANMTFRTCCLRRRSAL